MQRDLIDHAASPSISLPLPSRANLARAPAGRVRESLEFSRTRSRSIAKQRRASELQINGKKRTFSDPRRWRDFNF